MVVLGLPCGGAGPTLREERRAFEMIGNKVPLGFPKKNISQWFSQWSEESVRVGGKARVRKEIRRKKKELT